MVRPSRITHLIPIDYCSWHADTTEDGARSTEYMQASILVSHSTKLELSPGLHDPRIPRF